jgi:hypothetical protein
MKDAVGWLAISDHDDDDGISISSVSVRGYEVSIPAGMYRACGGQ